MGNWLETHSKELEEGSTLGRLQERRYSNSAFVVIEDPIKMGAMAEFEEVFARSDRPYQGQGLTSQEEYLFALLALE